MGSVLSYSGVSTKIRAMSSHLVTDEQLQEIVRFSDVPQVAAYLKKTPEYAKAWSLSRIIYRLSVPFFPSFSIFKYFTSISQKKPVKVCLNFS